MDFDAVLPITSILNEDGVRSAADFVDSFNIALLQDGLGSIGRAVAWIERRPF